MKRCIRVISVGLVVSFLVSGCQKPQQPQQKPTGTVRSFGNAPLPTSKTSMLSSLLTSNNVDGRDIQNYVNQKIEVPMPRIGKEFAVSDGTTCNGSNNECNVIARIDNNLYIAYSPGAPSASALAKIKVFDITNQAFTKTLTTPIATSDYHFQATLLATGNKQLVCLCGRTYASSSPPYTSWTPTRSLTQRSAVSPSVNGIDTMGVVDQNGDLHVVMQLQTAVTSIDGIAAPKAPSAAFGRAYWRIQTNPTTSALTADGPYIIVDSRSSTMTKGDLVIGKERTGKRTLYLVWNIRYSGSMSTDCFYNYNLYIAKSTDGGNTWQNINGSFSLPNTGHGIAIRAYPAPGKPSSLVPPVDVAANDWSNWAQYKFYDGNCGQGSERAFDVDTQGRVFVAVVEYASGGITYPVQSELSKGYYLPQPPTSQDFVVDTWRPAKYRLVYNRWNGSSWDKGVIDSSLNFENQVPKVRIDENGGIWIFTTVSGLCYYYSGNDGQTWTGPIQIRNADQGRTTGQSSANRIFSYRDPVDPRFHHLAYDANSGARSLITLQLTK